MKLLSSLEPRQDTIEKRKKENARKLRRYCKRWRIERLFAWIQDYM